MKKLVYRNYVTKSGDIVDVDFDFSIPEMENGMMSPLGSEEVYINFVIKNGECLPVKSEDKIGISQAIKEWIFSGCPKRSAND